jgi:hypothetical protein
MRSGVGDIASRAMTWGMAALPLEEWPLDLCGNGESAGPFIGLHFLVDLDASQVSAVSPIWHHTRCL